MPDTPDASLPDVAVASEALMDIAARTSKPRIRPGPRDAGLRRARVCYDHLAGEKAVRLLRRMRERGFITADDDSMRYLRRVKGTRLVMLSLRGESFEETL